MAAPSDRITGVVTLADTDSTLFIAIPEGAYPSRDEAMKALDAFVERSGMPRASIVAAGGESALYVWWRLSEAISRAERRSLSRSLNVACAQLGLRIDKRLSGRRAELLPALTLQVRVAAGPTAFDLTHPSSRRRVA